MKPVHIIVNGRAISEHIEPRMHLADFLRERLNLTATHLRCEQGACGACTLLIDGQPARSCITFAALCDGADITTVEGLEHDAIMVALRHAFSGEHGLQCGYCTPGMLITARDIVIRLPDADQSRLRLELSGNLCRCTGYVGIVRAITRVLEQRRRGELTDVVRKDAPLGPVGARPARGLTSEAESAPVAEEEIAEAPAAERALGLAGRQPNIEIRQSFAVSRPVDEVWTFLADPARIVPCLPGASLVGPPSGELVSGKMSVKLGPVTATFTGDARIVRDDIRRCGTILGAGNDRFGGSRAAGEVDYVLEAAEPEGTRVVLTIRALLAGPLAQFGRSGIVEDLVARMTDAFARNLEARITGAGADDLRSAQAPLAAGNLLCQVLAARVKKLFGRS